MIKASRFKVARRNPGSPQRHIEANEQRTAKRIEQWQGITALLRTWELQPAEVQSQNHDYIIRLRARERNIKNYLLHRSDARINFV